MIETSSLDFSEKKTSSLELDLSIWASFFATIEE